MSWLQGHRSPVNRIACGVFALKALSSSFNETPTKASRPYDKDRDGFVMGEGRACWCSRNTSMPAPRRQNLRGAHGLRTSGDAYHITRQRRTARGVALHECGDQARGRVGGGDRLHQRASAPDADGRRDRAGAVQRLVGNAAGRITMSSTNRRSGICWVRRVRLRRFFHPGDPRQRCAADAQPRQSVCGDADRSGPVPGAQAGDSYGAVEFVRIWRNQRLADFRRYAS